MRVVCKMLVVVSVNAAESLAEIAVITATADDSLSAPLSLAVIGVEPTGSAS